MACAGKWSTLKGVQLAPEMVAALESMGYFFMTPVQAAGIPPLLMSQDVCADAETGSGKTLAFLVPIAQALLFGRSLAPKPSPNTRALVILPTRELARQVHTVARALFDALPGDVMPYAVVGGEAADESSLAKAKDLRVVIATPGRLRAELVAGNIRAAQLEILILDEADRLLDMGFDVTLTSILSRLPKQRRTGLYSATQSESVEELARAGLRNPVRVAVKVKSASNKDQAVQRTPASLSEHYAIVRQNDKISALCALLAERPDDKVIVYFLTCASVHFHSMLPFAEFLASRGGNANGKRQFFALHGKMMQQKRTRNLRLFASSDNGVLFCTDVAARGIDLPDVDTVVQFDVPQDPDVYVHRVGRTARLGRSGYSLIMLTPEEEAYIGFLKLRKCPVVELAKADENVVGNMHAALEMFEVNLDDEDVENESLSTARLELNADVRKVIVGNRAVLDASEKAFLSFLRGYKEHRCKYILKLEMLDVNAIVLSFHLLRVPRFHEFKRFKQKLNFVKDESVCVRDIAYLDERQEAKRQRMILEAEEARKTGPKKKPRAKESGKNARGKKRKTSDDFGDDDSDMEDFGRAASLLKKVRQGKLSADSADVMLDDEEAQIVKSKRRKAKKKKRRSR